MVSGFDKRLDSVFDVVVNGSLQRVADASVVPRAGGFMPVGPLRSARPGGQSPSGPTAPKPPAVHPISRPSRTPRTGILKPTRACYFHNHGGCSKTDEQCSHDHVLLPEDARSKMVRPGPKRSRSPPEGGRDDMGPRTGEPGLSGPGGLCRFFITGTCKKGDDCRFTHVPNAERARVERARSAASPPPAPVQAVATPPTTRRSNLVARPPFVGPRFINLAANDEE